MNHPETAPEGSSHPIHQYPPPCLEDEEGSENKMLQSNEGVPTWTDFVSP